MAIGHTYGVKNGAYEWLQSHGQSPQALGERFEARHDRISMSGINPQTSGANTMTKRNDSRVTPSSAHGEAGSSKYSSNGNEREMRKETTHSEAAARAKHIATDTTPPMFNNKKPDTRG